MKKFLILSVCLVIILFMFSSCKQTSLPEDLEKIESLEKSIEARDKRIEELNTELEETQKALLEAEEKQTAEEVVEAEGEPEEEEKSAEEIKEETRDIFKEYIEGELGGQLTKFVLDDTNDNPENWIAYISYNSKWASEDTIKREMYTIVDLYAQSLFGIFYELDLTATSSHSGDNYNCFNSRELLGKIYNYEMDYAEWLTESF